MTWRPAKSIPVLQKQLDTLAPFRKKPDWIVGDAAHATTGSDHNPNSAGVVQAIDLQHDPVNGFDSYKFAEILRKNKDKRTKYVISNKKIFAGNDGPQPWTWRAYTRPNPHDKHVHVSVEDAASLYDNTALWDLGGFVALPDTSAPRQTLPSLELKAEGFYVSMVQTCLGGSIVDGHFGPMTRQALLQFQRDHNLDDDGIVGPYTWKELLRPWALEVGFVEPPAPVAPPVELPALPEPPKPLIPAVVKREYHSVVQGGFFSKNPFDKSVNTSIRTNNPGALNWSKSVEVIPGYSGAVTTSPGNRTAYFWAPEYGVLAWWDLLDRYAMLGQTTVGQIIKRYGGGQDYSEYEKFVVNTTGLPASYKIKIDGSDDANLLKFAKAMFRYEAGVNTPLSDLQIMVGFGMGRERARMK